MAVRISCIIHCFVLLAFSGCALHTLPAGPPFHDTDVTQAKHFVEAVDDKMPMWDTDVLAPYERQAIATVKADIAIARQSQERSALLDSVQKLHEDWDALIALDELLKTVSVT
jgi:hypothetical protein